jgi:hypothetical protein
MITIEDFQKIDLRIATIVAAENEPRAGEPARRREPGDAPRHT